MNTPRALITGITGQDGSYLAEFLLARGYDVWGIVRRASSANTQRIDHLLNDEKTAARLHLCCGDLQDSASLSRIIQLARPTEVYNLAAQSHVHVSFETPVYTGDVTGLGAVRLLEAIHESGLDSKFYQASSSELYGKVRETPQTENTPFYPRSPYAAAKAYAYYITQNYRESYGLFATNGILFNHESPRRGETFVTRKISRAVGRIAAGLESCVSLGNLDSQRDWGFAGDYVVAMWQMMQQPVASDFVVATGEMHTVREFCEVAFDQIDQPLTWEGSGVDEVGVAPDGQVRVRIDSRFFRPAEVDLLCGDASLAQSRLGWSPKVTFPQLVRMMVDHDVRLAEGEAGQGKPGGNGVLRTMSSIP